MEEQLKKLKSEMLNDELAGFEFDARMKRNVSRLVEEKPRKSFRFRGIMPAAMSAAFLVIFSVGVYWLVDDYYSNDLGDTPPVVEEENPVVDDPEKVAKFDEAMATALLDRYEDAVDTLVDDAGVYPDLKLKSYSNLDEVHALFSDFMAREMVEKVVAERVVKAEDGLHLRPVVGNFNYLIHIPYTFERISETEYHFTQNQDVEGESPKRFTAVFKYHAGAWKIESIEEFEFFNEMYAETLLRQYKGALSKNHKTEEEFYKELRGFMANELVEQLDLPLGEGPDGVFVQGTDTIITFWDDTPYDLEKISDEEYKLTQIQDSDLHGLTSFTAIFKSKEHSWKIASLQIEKLPEQPLEEKQAIELLERYESTLNTVLEDALKNPGYKFGTYRTKEEFYAGLTPFMAYEIVEATYNYRLTEKEDGLYLEPMDSPDMYWPGTPYQFVKENDRIYKLIQKREGDLNGKETFTATFGKRDGQWIITNIFTER